MKNWKISILIFTITFFVSKLSYSQIWDFMFQSEKVAIFPEANTGFLLTTAQGNGYETALGGGLELSPFKRFFYIKFAAKHVLQFTHDSSPNVDVFTNFPDEIKMQSTFSRFEYGVKVRLDWWFKKVRYRGVHFLLGTYYFNDIFSKEESSLFFGSNTIKSTTTNYSAFNYNGQIYELGMSWVFNDSLKWDSSLFAYYSLENHSLLQNGLGFLPHSKTSFGISTALFLLF